MDTTRFARKVFAVTVTGIAYSGETITETVNVETHGDAEQAKRIVITQAWPMRMRTAERWDVARV